MQPTDDYGARVRAVRAYARLEQADLAAALEVSTATISRIEDNHRPLTIPEARMIADTCNAPLEFLLYGWGMLARPGAVAASASQANVETTVRVEAPEAAPEENET